MSYVRFAVYYVPPVGPLADFGAKWLGWDIVTGQSMPQFDLPGLHDVTVTPRKYGFHGTLKPPFHLQGGQTPGDLQDAVAALAHAMPPVVCGGLQITPLGRFLALTPQAPLDGLQNLAAACVRDLDPFRAPPMPDELTRRRQAGLSARQDALLLQWGYPYVLDQFRFHLTLTGALPAESLPVWQDRLTRYLPSLPERFVVDQIGLCGQRTDGQFELIHRYTLAG